MTGEMTLYTQKTTHKDKRQEIKQGLITGDAAGRKKQLLC